MTTRDQSRVTHWLPRSRVAFVGSKQGRWVVIRRSLNIADFSMRLVVLLLPQFAFALAGYIRFGSGRIPSATYDIRADD